MKYPVIAAVILVFILAVPTLRVEAGPAFQFTLTDNWTTPSFGVVDLAGGAGSDFASSTWVSAVNADGQYG